MSVVSAVPQPPPTGPIAASASSATSSKNTSLNSGSPEIWRSGRIVTPGASIGTRNIVRPLCLGTSGSVRASSIPNAAKCAFVVHTFWPDSRHVPSSCARRARLDRRQVRPRRGLGEELAPDLVAVQHRPEVALLLLLGAVGDDRRAEHADADRVEDPRHARRASSWLTITCSTGPRPCPPDSTGHVTPARPAFARRPCHALAQRCPPRRGRSRPAPREACSPSQPRTLRGTGPARECRSNPPSRSFG